MSDRGTERSGMDRRTFLRVAGAAGAGALAGPHLMDVAWGAQVAGNTPEERAINGAKALKKNIDLNVLIWGQFYNGKMRDLAGEFKEKTGIGIGGVQDLAAPAIPPKAMAEALAKSSAFDIIHMDAHMIPTLANAGYLHPLDKFMERGGMIYRSVGPQMVEQNRYHGETYGFVTDGNTHVTGLRKDYFENPEERKRFEDKHGKPLRWPETWDDYLELASFFNRPDFFGVAELRSRKWSGPIWYLMRFYANGGFPFADDMTPTLYNDAGRKAMEWYLGTKPYSAKDTAIWGSPQTIPFVAGGGAFMWTYWTGGFGAAERAGSKTQGKWIYGVAPGSRMQGRLVKRSVSSPFSLFINRRSQNTEAAYWLCQYWASPKHSTEIVADTKITFHDPWAPEHMKDPRVLAKYTPGGVKATVDSLEVTAPQLLLPGYLEFNDILDKNLADAFTGVVSGDEALKKTEAEWRDIIKRIGSRLLVKDLANYKAALPKIDLPKG